MTTRIATAILLFATAMGATAALADTVSIPAIKDNTLYESADGERSNAIGPTMFAGKTFQGFEDIRRALVAFDVAGNVPAGATITGAELTLYVSKTAMFVPPTTISLHRLTSDWGEGTSAADSTGGFGVPSTPNDATWIHTFFNGSFWGTPGGDFVAAASSSAPVSGNGFYNWSAGLGSDVQLWLNTPAANFGWIVRADETDSGTARRFNTREHPTVSTRPVLTIHYDPPIIPVEPSTWGRVKAIYSGR